MMLMIRVMIGQATQYLLRVLIVLSILVNVLLGGHINQTFSARNWERKKNKKLHMVKLIDTVLGKGHCAEAWVWWKTRGW